MRATDSHLQEQGRWVAAGVRPISVEEAVKADETLGAATHLRQALDCSGDWGLPIPMIVERRDGYADVGFAAQPWVIEPSSGLGTTCPHLTETACYGYWTVTPLTPSLGRPILATVCLARNTMPSRKVTRCQTPSTTRKPLSLLLRDSYFAATRLEGPGAATDISSIELVVDDGESRVELVLVLHPSNPPA